LGHVVSKQENKVDPQKVKAIIDWPRHTTIIDIISLHYLRFATDFSKIASPLISLLKKAVKFEWTEKCKRAF